MLIRVEHTTAYHYSSPLRSSTQYLRKTPLSGRTQTVESWKLSCPGALLTNWYDQYNNLCHTLTVAEPVAKLEIKVSGLVRTRETSGVFGIAQAELPASIYLRETPHTVSGPAILDFAAPFTSKIRSDQIAALHEIMLAIGDAVEYRKGETDVRTTGAEALEKRSGVCQDHAHIFCAVVRTLGVPARYISGYLSQGTDGKAQAASHAWAEAFVDDLGWVGFDPANRSSATEAYVRTAVGLDYAEAGPVRGVRSGGGEETMSVSVTFPDQQQ